MRFAVRARLLAAGVRGLLRRAVTVVVSAAAAAASGCLSALGVGASPIAAASLAPVVVGGVAGDGRLYARPAALASARSSFSC